MSEIEVSVEMETCFACLTKSEAVFITLLPAILVIAWFLIESWIRK